jgi:retron-type reverse transcriptase
MARAPAARVLRRLVKDADTLVRKTARAMVVRLGLDDVALPDTRFPKPRHVRPFAIGGWNPTGWAFGLYRPRRRQPPGGRRGAAPVAATIDELARFLGLPSAGALRALMRPGTGSGAPYVAFALAKRKGGTRAIHAPRKELKRVQRKILEGILAQAPAHDAAHGFVVGRSVVTNAAVHRGAHVVVKLDLRDFFPSVHFRRVAGLFETLGYSEDVARTLAGLCTHRAVLADGRVAWPGVLPQGAPTSPAITNLLCRRMDSRLSSLAAKVGAKYTRYADDLTFSFAKKPEVRLGRFLWWVDQICQQEGFDENGGKRRVMRKSGQQRVTGVVVSGKALTVPREARRNFRALLHRARTRGLDAVAKERGLSGPASLVAELDGFAAWVQMVQPALGARLRAEIRALGAARAPTEDAPA